MLLLNPDQKYIHILNLRKLSLNNISTAEVTPSVFTEKMNIQINVAFVYYLNEVILHIPRYTELKLPHQLYFSVIFRTLLIQLTEAVECANCISAEV